MDATSREEGEGCCDGARQSRVTDLSSEAFSSSTASLKDGPARRVRFAQKQAEREKRFNVFSTGCPDDPIFLVPRRTRARQRMLVVFPQPGGPCASGELACERIWKKQNQTCRRPRQRTEKMRFGIFPWLAIAFIRSTASALPTMSSSSCGRYFSTHLRRRSARAAQDAQPLAIDASHCVQMARAPTARTA